MGGSGFGVVETMAGVGSGKGKGVAGEPVWESGRLLIITNTTAAMATPATAMPMPRLELEGDEVCAGAGAAGCAGCDAAGAERCTCGRLDAGGRCCAGFDMMVRCSGGKAAGDLRMASTSVRISLVAW